MADAAPRLRPAVRALVLDEHDRVLLVRFDFDDRTVWGSPGGGIEAGESSHDALVRELREEIGLTDPEVGPALWHAPASTVTELPKARPD
jgi:8-oxo-dGTP pyrophosphatase MutT (NUDIX family)